MEISEFDWDDNNVQYIIRHRVAPEEVEEVAFDDDPLIRRGGKGTRYMLGYTIAGRYLFTVYRLRGKGTARIITAMDMDKRTKRLYRKGRKGEKDTGV